MYYVNILATVLKWNEKTVDVSAMGRRRRTIDILLTTRTNQSQCIMDTPQYTWV